MRKGFGAGLSLLCGLAIFLFVPYAAEGTEEGSPQIELFGATPLQNADIVIFSGKNFPPGEDLTGFGAVVKLMPKNPSQKDGLIAYRGYNLPEVSARTNDRGSFRLEVPLNMLKGVHGGVELSLYHRGRVLQSNPLEVSDPSTLPPYSL